MRDIPVSSKGRSESLASLLVAVCGLCLFPPALRAQNLPELPNVVFENFEPEIREQVRKAYAGAQSKPRDAQANGWPGMTLHTYEQYEFAAVCYERAHRLAPDEFRWAYYLGTVQAALGRNREAAAAFKDALRLDRDHLPAQLKLADALLADGQLEESRQFYEIVVKRNAGISQAYYGRGRSCERGKNRSGAARTATAVI